MATEVNQENADPVDDLAHGIEKLTTDGADGSAPKRTRAPRKRRANRKKTEGGETVVTTGAADEGEPREIVEHDNTAKVFVGNLSFETTPQEIEEIFGNAGKIANVNIITRGERSLGYGFISYENDADADKAVETLDKTEIAGREINVERAQDKDPKAVRSRATRGRGGKGYSRGRAAHEDGPARVDGEDATNGDDTAETTPGARGTRRTRAPRAPRERSGETSATSLFVANLPFKTTDADLADVFKQYNVVSAHVVTLRSGRSKGFGFVEAATHEEQQKILADLTNVVVDDRELVIKVAMANQTAPAEGTTEAQ